VTQTNYTINTANRNYLYGNLSYEENKFSSFDSQASLSTGWGRRWFDTKNASLDADVGPGFKRDVTRRSHVPSETQDSIILQAQALYIRKMNEHIEFKQLLIAKYAIESGQNSSYKAESSVTSKLIEALQLKLSFTVDYNSKVDIDKTNTDTQTSAVLVYSF
jgi:putative salt-induced outer membrane protein YdiY